MSAVLEAEPIALGDIESTFVPATDRLPRLCFVGDTHVEPGQDLRRFHWLGQFCRDFLDGPDDELILFGDHFNVDALFWKASRVQQEGKRFLNEKAAGNRARQYIDLATFDMPLKKTVLEGNHCARVRKFVTDHPYFSGAFTLWDEFEGNGWNVVPFRSGNGMHVAKGWRCQHFFPGRSGRPTGSQTGNARAVIEKVVRHGESVAFGHTHEYDTWYCASRTKVTRGVNVGCFFEHDEDYAGPDSNSRWWRGIILVENAVDGDGDIREFSMRTLERMYG